jgi:hypothetical protein
MAQLYLFPGGGSAPARTQASSIALRQRVLEDILAPVPGESVANEEAHAFRALGTVLDRLIELAGADITIECLRALTKTRGLTIEE